MHVGDGAEGGQVGEVSHKELQSPADKEQIKLLLIGQHMKPKLVIAPDIREVSVVVLFLQDIPFLPGASRVQQ